MKIIIVGYGPGGVSAATSAKLFDRTADVTIYTKEHFEAHKKPGASLALEKPGTNELMIGDWSFDALSKAGINIVKDTTVTSINHEKRTLKVKESGSEKDIQYDKLILATGGIPSVPSIKGTNLSGVFTIQDMSDTTEIGNQLKAMETIFVIGAGFSGLEISEKLLELEKRVHLVVRSRLLRKLLEEPMSAELYSRLPSKLQVHSGVSPDEVVGTKQVEGIKLDGVTHKADAVLFMTGVKPNTKLALQMGLEVGELGGVKVSNVLETSLEDVYSVGDCVEMFDRLTGKPVLMPIGSVAARAGRQAGVAAVGGKKVYDDVSIKFQYDRIFKTDIVCIGHSSVTANALEIPTHIHYLEDPAEFTKVALVTKEDGTLIGGQVIASRQGAKIGYQIHQRVEIGAKLDSTPLLEPLHKRLSDLLEETLGPIQ